MLALQKGFALWVVMVSMLLTMLVAEYLYTSLSEMMSMVYQWKNQQHQRERLTQIMTELLTSKPKEGHYYAQTFDYSWQYLGEYSCVLRCLPQCYGTEHWILSVHLKPLIAIWRVAFQNKDLICDKSLAIHLLNPVLYEEIDFET